jgi:type IV secretory pathway TrbF-like protein
MSTIAEDSSQALEPSTTANRNEAHETPYLATRLKWRSEVERAFASARTWQVIGMAGMLAGLGAVGGLIYLASQPRFTPYVVEVDKLGEAVAVRPAERAGQADPRVIRAFLASWVASARQITPDIALQGQAVVRVYAMLRMRDPAKLKIDEWWNPEKKDRYPYSRAATEAVNVQVSTPQPIAGDAWQVDWTETVRDRDGALKEPPAKWRAILNIYTTPLNQGVTEEDLQGNPFGIYVLDFNWSRIP